MHIDSWHPLVLKILAIIGVITIISAVAHYFESPKKYCRHGDELSFPIDKECVIEMNVEGKNFGWTLIPYRENEKKLK